MGYRSDLYWVYYCYHLINDLDFGISSEVSKFADDIKVGKVIRTEQNASDLQGHLHRFYDWARVADGV